MEKGHQNTVFWALFIQDLPVFIFFVFFFCDYFRNGNNNLCEKSARNQIIWWCVNRCRNRIVWKIISRNLHAATHTKDHNKPKNAPKKTGFLQQTKCNRNDIFSLSLDMQFFLYFLFLSLAADAVLRWLPFFFFYLFFSFFFPSLFLPSFFFAFHSLFSVCVFCFFLFFLFLSFPIQIVVFVMRQKWWIMNAYRLSQSTS